MNSAQGECFTETMRLDTMLRPHDWEECNRIGNLLADGPLRNLSAANIRKENPELFTAPPNQAEFPL